jgi:hypothetical protein
VLQAERRTLSNFKAGPAGATRAKFPKSGDYAIWLVKGEANAGWPIDAAISDYCGDPIL